MGDKVLHSNADLWATLSHVQRVSWLSRAKVQDQVKEHAHKDWLQLPGKIAAALGAVK